MLCFYVVIVLGYVKNKESGREKWENIKIEFGQGLTDAINWLDNLPMYIDDKDFLVVLRFQISGERYIDDDRFPACPGRLGR